MPEAQKEQIQDDKLVPIDTSGESVDVELKESKVTPVEEEQEVVEEQQAAPEPEKTEEEKPSTDKGEHDEYSEKVNKRIAKLVGKLREAERREDAAVKYAAGLKNKQTDLETQLQSLNQNYASTMETASTSQVEEAKLRLKKAIYISDISMEQEILGLLKPIINSNSVWKNHALKFLGDFYYSNDQQLKAKQYYLTLSENEVITSSGSSGKID